MGPLARRTAARRSGGFVLILTLITLVILTLSAMSMMLVMQGGTSVAGNIAFRQAAVNVADIAVEDAVKWLNSQSFDYLAVDHADVGYYATSRDPDSATVMSLPPFDPKAHDFGDPAQAKTHTGTVSGYTIAYVIHRMARYTGTCAAVADNCLYPVNTPNTWDGINNGGAQPQITITKGLVYYRITVKVQGPRFNNRYVQAFVY